MKVKVISVLEDNYMYLIIEESTGHAIAVDAAVSKRLLEIIQRENLTLKAILTTHHHWDHARDNQVLASVYPGLEIYGGDERVGALTHRVTHEEELKKIFCGHEYTARNLKFALRVEPENEFVKEKLIWAKLREDEDLPTVPSTMAEEFLYNPFLRVLEEPVQKFTTKSTPVEVFAALCRARDSFRKPKEQLNPHARLAFEWGLLNPLLQK